MNGFLIKKVHIFNENGGNVERQERNGKLINLTRSHMIIKIVL